MMTNHSERNLPQVLNDNPLNISACQPPLTVVSSGPTLFGSHFSDIKLSACAWLSKTAVRLIRKAKQKRKSFVLKPQPPGADAESCWQPRNSCCCWFCSTKAAGPLTIARMGLLLHLGLFRNIFGRLACRLRVAYDASNLTWLW